MKKKEFNDFKNKSMDGLKKTIIETQKQVIEKNLDLKMGKSKNVHEVKVKRKDLARLKTLLRNKFLSENIKEIVNAS